jgi:hypothetical protein
VKERNEQELRVRDTNLLAELKRSEEMLAESQRERVALEVALEAVRRQLDDLNLLTSTQADKISNFGDGSQLSKFHFIIIFSLFLF